MKLYQNPIFFWKCRTKQDHGVMINDNPKKKYIELSMVLYSIDINSDKLELKIIDVTSRISKVVCSSRDIMMIQKNNTLCGLFSNIQFLKNNDVFKHVSAIANHYQTSIIFSKNTLFTQSLYSEIREINNIFNVSMVACGKSHFAFISDGYLYTFGDGSHGKLGHRNNKSIELLKKINKLSNVSAVACGNNHTAAIMNGRLYTFGKGVLGQLGHGNHFDYYGPKKIKNFKHVTMVACRDYCTTFINKKEMYIAGYIDKATTGTVIRVEPDPVENRISVPLPSLSGVEPDPVENRISVPLPSLSGVEQMFESSIDIKAPQKVNNLVNITSIVCEKRIAVISDGSLYIYLMMNQMILQHSKK